jgi:BirA family biotin operon repressor/biotin-[acetyl-CoA-carboxylase] ligase
MHECIASLNVIPTCTSTNSALPADAPHGYVLMAMEQTAGRGQRGNSWEAAPGLNITLSMMLHPRVDAANQFAISEAVALAVVDTLVAAGLAQVSVKWPNDIYVADRKICGILIENSLTGVRVARSVVGIGLNVNQPEFCSDAPNPVSMLQLLGRPTALEPLAQAMCNRILERLEQPAAENHADYISLLWRGQGLWQWRIAETGEVVTASIVDVLPTGHLLLSHSPSTPFAFKTVSPVM